MSTTVSYKGNTIATLNNETKTLTTAGTWVEGNITVTDTMSGVKPKVTITSTGHSSSCYVQYNGTKYYTAEDSFEFNEGDTLYCYAAHSEGGSIYINDETVAISGTTGVNYTLTLGKYDINVQLSYSRSPVIRISLPIIPSGTYSVSNSGTFPIPNYSKVSVASGTAGTPTATKGSVSNHSISVTPSVTNTTGYITGGTKTGTAVTVTASELASGNKEITQNGTNIDVVGYSTVSVAVPSSSTAIITDTTDAAGGTIRTITTTDEVHLQTKTITPTSTQQTVLPDTGYDGFSSVIVGASSGGSSSQTVTGTFTGSDGNTIQISCDFEPREIYIRGDLTGDVSLRGIVSFTLIKDRQLIITNDSSTSNTAENAWIIKPITGYNQANSSSEPYASYSNNTLTIDTVMNSGSARFPSGITYNYTLISSSGGNTDTWETLLSTQVTMTQGTLYYFRINNYTEPITVNDEYRITWGTVTHTFVPLLDSQDDSYYIGNPVINGGTDDGSGIPLILYKSDSTHLTGETTDSGSKYLKIERKVSGGSTPSATAHEIYFEFSDGTDTTIDVYYDDSLISTMITAYTPVTYGQKTVTLAELDGVAWYNPANIPLNTQLVDYTTITRDYSLNTDGTLKEDQWYGATDYIMIDPTMTFSFKANMWGYDAFYDASKTFISVFNPYNYSIPADPNNSNVAVGTIGGSGISIPSNAKFIRLTTLAEPNDTVCSLIRTA